MKYAYLCSTKNIAQIKRRSQLSRPVGFLSSTAINVRLNEEHFANFLCNVS